MQHEYTDDEILHAWNHRKYLPGQMFKTLDNLKAFLAALPERPQAQPVVVNEQPQDEKQPDLFGESERQTEEPAQPCVCGSPTTIGTVHRSDGPCYQEPAQPWTPAVGDVVRLKSGGPMMTVMDAEEDGEFWCLWFDPCGNKEGMDFPAACLTPAQP
jgi:uncharacterized protein YodC (DUF2158 family)